MKSLCGKRSLAAHRRKGVHNRGFTSGRKGRDWSVIKIHNRAISKSCCCSSTSTSFRVGSYEERCQEEIRDVHLPDNDDDAWGPLGARWFLTGEYRCSGGGSLFTRNYARESWSFAVKEKLTSQFLIRFLNSFWNLCFSCLKCPLTKHFYLFNQPSTGNVCLPHRMIYSPNRSDEFMGLILRRRWFGFPAQLGPNPIYENGSLVDVLNNFAVCPEAAADLMNNSAPIRHISVRSPKLAYFDEKKISFCKLFFLLLKALFHFATQSKSSSKKSHRQSNRFAKFESKRIRLDERDAWCLFPGVVEINFCTTFPEAIFPTDRLFITQSGRKSAVQSVPAPDTWTEEDADLIPCVLRRKKANQERKSCSFILAGAVFMQVR